MDYEILGKESIPRKERGGKWTNIFDSLDFSKTIRFKFSSEEERTRVRTNIYSSLRGRRATYRISYRCFQAEDHFMLFVWKEKPKEA